MKRRVLAVFLVLVLGLASLPARAGDFAATPGVSAPTLERMIGQMLIIGFPGVSISEDWPSRVRCMIHNGEIGGVLLLSRNIVSPRQLRALTKSLALTGSEVKPFIMVDQEGGAVQRLTTHKGFRHLPAAQDVAEMHPLLAFRLYLHQARQLAAAGITVNLGPVVDLHINPQNPVIAKLKRSFGKMPSTVIRYARTFIRAHFDVGVLTAAKHFPGHGSGSTDPHEATLNVSNSWKVEELEPFNALMNDPRPVPMIMVGHQVLVGFSDGDAPASLSHLAVTQILRNELGYPGLIVTDDLEMAAVRQRYGIEEAVVKAVAAGNDLIIVSNREMPDPYVVARITAAITVAVARGEIAEARIRQSYQRILLAKHMIERMLARPQPAFCESRHCFPFWALSAS
ncbi:MAG TPA: glycoside hydrolase family 3 N-terminal domain-containing protein [Aestuariivirgaceae bacterium]|jgi:beta-N-acetylhexosaminidase